VKLALLTNAVAITGGAWRHGGDLIRRGATLSQRQATPITNASKCPSGNSCLAQAHWFWGWRCYPQLSTEVVDKVLGGDTKHSRRESRRGLEMGC